VKNQEQWTLLQQLINDLASLREQMLLIGADLPEKVSPYPHQPVRDPEKAAAYYERHTGLYLEEVRKTIGALTNEVLWLARFDSARTFHTAEAEKLKGGTK
jgi:hypothetical protein